MPGAIGDQAGAAAGEAIGGPAGVADDDGSKAKAFAKVLSHFAAQIVESNMDDMDRAMQETEEDFQ